MPDCITFPSLFIGPTRNMAEAKIEVKCPERRSPKRTSVVRKVPQHPSSNAGTLVAFPRGCICHCNVLRFRGRWIVRPSIDASKQIWWGNSDPGYKQNCSEYYCIRCSKPLHIPTQAIKYQASLIRCTIYAFGTESNLSTLSRIGWKIPYPLI